ncbi:MAG: TlpA family protein disulfide reductase [Pseudomonadota bacterium]
MIRALALCLGLCVCVATQAQEVRPFMRGSQQAIVAAHQGQSFVLALWSLDCAHCRDDLALLGKLQAKYRKIKVVLVATDAPARQREIQAVARQYRLHRAESWVFADSFVERLRYEIDPQWYGELPRTYFFDTHGQATAVSGKLAPQATEDWVRGATL